MGSSTKEIWYWRSLNKEVCRKPLPKVSDGINERFGEAQYYKFQKIAYKIITKGMCLDEQFQIVFIIGKLPHSLNVFKIFASPQDKRIFN